MAHSQVRGDEQELLARPAVPGLTAREHNIGELT